MKQMHLHFLSSQISVPMSVEFEELAKLRENPTEESISMYN